MRGHLTCAYGSDSAILTYKRYMLNLIIAAIVDRAAEAQREAAIERDKKHQTDFLDLKRGGDGHFRKMDGGKSGHVNCQ